MVRYAYVRMCGSADPPPRTGPLLSSWAPLIRVDHVDPVVGVVVCVARERRGAGVDVYAITTIDARHQSMQRRVIRPAGAEVHLVGSIVATVGVIRRHVGGI